MREQRSCDTVSKAMSDLQKIGYTVDFTIMTEKECIYRHKTQKELSPEDFKIDQFYRFEGITDSGDEMIVYAISSDKYNMKGIVVNAFGLYSEHDTWEIIKKLKKE